MGTAHAQPTNCHALAASPSDPARKAAGVPYAKIDGANAVLACQAAVTRLPKDGQLWFQYGRALEKNNQVATAFKAYQTGADLGDPGSLNNLGELYRDGKGVTRDLYQAEVLFQNAASANFPEAADNLSALEKKKPSLASRTIPAQYRGKFALPGGTCQQTQEMSQAFGGQFMGVEVDSTEIFRQQEFQCTVLGLNIDTPQQMTAVLKCTQNGPDVSLRKAVLTSTSVRFEPMAQNPGAISIRCSN